MKIIYPKGATPLDPNELEGLLLPLKTLGQLNEAERRGILRARLKAQRGRKLKREILSVTGLFQLHREMFSSVWAWAGTPRKSEKNLGVPPHQIQVKLRELALNVEYQIETVASENWPELAADFHHQMVSIHPFPNGNGRHARLATDILSWRVKQIEPNWGTQFPFEKQRDMYLAALKKADNGDLKPLAQFMFRP